MQVNLDAPLPAELGVGLGTALFLHGTCFDAERDIRGLGFRVLGDGQASDELQPATASAMPRLDYFRALHPGLDPFASPHAAFDAEAPEDPHLRGYRSGFWGLVRIAPAVPGSELEVKLEASFRGGRSETVGLGDIRVAVPPEPLAPELPGPPTEPRVAICMATHEPPLDLLRRQLDSIRGQDHSNWVCVISDDCSRPASFDAIRRMVGDDSRFAISRSPRRLGFYANFERALALAPRDCDYVTLADQDDFWYPDKLRVLLDGLGPAQLVYSDMRIIGRGGEEIAGSYWERRRNNHTDLDSLLVANSVTGAASLFRRELLDYALPFPPGQFAHYHDHWLGLTALLTGGIEYVDRPLYDYVQHGDSAIGHAASTRVFTLRERARKLRWNRGRREPFYRATYFRHVERLMAFATILQMRCGDLISRSHRRSLEQFLALERSTLRLVALGWRAGRELTGPPETLGAEWTLWRALVWRRVLSATARDRPSRRLRLDGQPPADLALPSERRSIGDEASRALAGKMEPLALAVSLDAPPRINLLLATIDLDTLCRDDLAKLNLARRLATRGARVRLVTVEQNDERPRDWMSRVEAHTRLAGLFSKVEIELCCRTGSLEVSPRDSFIATSCWTAHMAARAARDLGGRRFVYLIHEFEPSAFPLGSYAALAAQSYRFEHFALFSSEFLRQYFCAHRIGVYADGTAVGDERSASFENPISSTVLPPTADKLRARRSRCLLVDLMPERDAARNMFELGVLALGRALEEGVFRSGWQLRGVGGLSRRGRIDLGGDVALELLPDAPHGAFGELLHDHDVGLALTYAPNPNLVAIEMAAAGMLAVTNTFENRLADELQAISSNLVPAAAAVDALADALIRAAAAVEDVERRVAGAAVNWSRSWNESFDDRLVERVAEQLRSV